MLIKIDTSGHEVFSKDIISCSYGGENSINTQKATENNMLVGQGIDGYITYDKSGNLIISGDYWGTCEFHSSQAKEKLLYNYDLACGGPPGCVANAHEYLAKFDTTGNIVWAYDFGLNGPDPDIIVTTNNGTIYTLGLLNYSADFDHTEITALLNNSGFGLYFAQYDSSCNFIGANEFMSCYCSMSAFKLFDNKTALLCGNFSDIYFAKYLKFDIPNNTHTSIQFENKIKTFKIWPNPTKSVFQIENTDKSLIENIKICNINGQKIKIIENYNSNSLIDVSSLNSGFYIIQIEFDNEKFFDKLIINK
jgi:hypothetical protein